MSLVDELPIEMPDGTELSEPELHDSDRARTTTAGASLAGTRSAGTRSAGTRLDDGPRVDHGARHVDAHPDDGERHDGESHAGSPLGDGASRNDPARRGPGPVRADGPASTADSVTALRRRISRPLPGGRTRDPRAAQRAVADLLVALGRDPSSEHLADTPRRVADALLEMTTPPDFDLTTFPNDEGYDEMVVAVGIPLHSLCEHHLLPFHGVAHIGYLPGDRILGISKLARVAELFARDLQVQERLTAQIADWLTENLNPRGVGVVISAEHLCQSLRGVRAPGVQTVTSALRGMLRTDGRTRDEFLSLTRR